MTRAIESISAIIKNFIDKDPKPPLHVGEVMDLRTIFTAFHEAHSLYQVALNSTIDPDLQHVVQNALEGSKKDTQDICRWSILENPFQTQLQFQKVLNCLMMKLPI